MEESECLNREQIIDEGWSPIESEDGLIHYIKKNSMGDVYLTKVRIRQDNPPDIRTLSIYRVKTIKGVKESDMLYRGTYKSIVEFKMLCEWLSI